MGSAFTVQYKKIENTLRTTIEINANGKSIKGVALWDTGATACCISHHAAVQLGLISTGKANMTTPNQTSEKDTYLIDIVLPNNVALNDVLVIDSDIENQHIEMLIGMNIINQGDMAVSNYDNKTTFTFKMPSESKIDYVKQIRVSNLIGTPHGQGRRKKNKNKKKKK